MIENEFGSLAVAGHHPAWKAAVPRDNGSSWDFEDVRDHYVHALFGEDAREVRWSDPERYLDLGRAAVCEAFASTLGYWRRPDSRCDGALTLALRDLEPGPGWGVLDWSGSPKAPWFVLRRSAKPIALLVTDDGMDGLRLDAINETAEPVVGEIRFRAHSRSGVVPVDVALPVKVEAHSSLTWSVDSLVGRFTDLTHVFRFGARTYDAVTVTLEDEDGEMVDEVVHLLGGSARPRERSVGLVATARNVGDEEWVVDVSTDASAQYVALELQGFRARRLLVPPRAERSQDCTPTENRSGDEGDRSRSGAQLARECGRGAADHSGHTILAVQADVEEDECYGKLNGSDCAARSHTDRIEPAHNSASVGILRSGCASATRHHCSGARSLTSLSSAQTALAGLAEVALADAAFTPVIESIGSAALDIVAPKPARPFIAAALAARTPVLLVTATGREADDLTSELTEMLGGGVAQFPSWETLPHERLSPSADTVGRRVEVLRRLARPDDASYGIASSSDRHHGALPRSADGARPGRDRTDHVARRHRDRFRFRSGSSG